MNGEKLTLIESENIRNVTDYLISFLVRDNDYIKYVHYVSENQALTDSREKRGNVYIVKSNFFGDNYGNVDSLPQGSLEEYRGIKILYGSPKEREENGNIIIYADLIASSFFVLTRYEEMLIDVRDCYDIFPATESILVKEGLINIPVVDRYGQIIRSHLRRLGYTIGEKRGFSKLYFTHDIDIPFSKYTFLGMIKTIGRSILFDKKLVFHPLLNYLGFYGINPKNTWDYMLSKEKDIKERIEIETESICFIVAAEKKDEYTQSYIREKKIIPMLDEMKSLGAVLGMHTSFAGATAGKYVIHERQVLMEVTGEEILYNRNHYLRQIRPYDMEFYEEAGFTDDFTTGFNEIIGFRLGTCHPVRWIDPRNCRISKLTLHGMHIMDGSVVGKKPYQMELSFEEAKTACKEIIDEIYENNGEFDFLCHNGMFEKTVSNKNYIKELYDWILEYILEKSGI